MVKLSCASEADLGLIPALAMDGFVFIFRSDDTGELKIGTPVATLSGVIGSALGLVGPVSVHCDWMR